MNYFPFIFLSSYLSWDGYYVRNVSTNFNLIFIILKMFMTFMNFPWWPLVEVAISFLCAINDDVLFGPCVSV